MRSLKKIIRMERFMRFYSIRKRIVTAVPRFSMIKATVLATSLVVSGFAHAEWQDPLESPALVTDRAHKGLLLDITRIGSRMVAVGSHGHIVYSDDSGKSWSQGLSPSSTTLTAVSFPTASKGWAVGHDGLILHSNDGGETWVKQFDGYLANLAIIKGARENKEIAIRELERANSSADASAIDNAEMELQNKTYALDDAEYEVTTGSTKPFLDVWFHDAKLGFAVGAYGMAFRTDDGGKNWVDWSIHLANRDRLHINGVTMVGPNSLMLVGEQGMILRSDDMGDNWRIMPSPYEGSLFGVMAKAEKVLVFGLRGNLFTSVNGGVEWQKVNTNSEQAIMEGVVKADNTSVMVGNGGSIVLLNRRSENPKSIILPSRISSVAVVQAPDGKLVIVGETGVKRIDANGEFIDGKITMEEGDI
jgi:photosystem II stability/assembly factor-like uncharacterized protein